MAEVICFGRFRGYECTITVNEIQQKSNEKKLLKDGLSGRWLKRLFRFKKTGSCCCCSIDSIQPNGRMKLLKCNALNLQANYIVHIFGCISLFWNSFFLLSQNFNFHDTQSDSTFFRFIWFSRIPESAMSFVSIFSSFFFLSPFNLEHFLLLFCFAVRR